MSILVLQLFKNQMKKKTIYLLFLILNYFAYSQNLGDIEHYFGYGKQEFSNIKALAIQTDGKIIIGNGTNNQSNRIYRLNTDGSIDKSFRNNVPVIEGSINAILIQIDGKIIVGGKFNKVGNLTQNNMTRLNSDGSLDTSFIGINGFNGEVLTLKSQSDGKILVGGRFTTYRTVTRNYLARLNNNGGLDTSFISYFDRDQSSSIDALSIQADGKILAGGNFISFNNSSIRRIIRLNTDGSKDESFSTGFGFNGLVKSLAIKPDGKILVGGWFDKYNIDNQNYIVCLNPDGTKDTNFGNETTFSGFIESIAMQSDGKIIIGGYFDKYNNINKNGICRLNLDGSSDLSFNADFGYDSTVHSIALNSDGKIFVGGNIKSLYGDKYIGGINCLNDDGSSNQIFNSLHGFTGEIEVFALQEDGKVIIGGDFGYYKGKFLNSLSRLNPDGTIDLSFNIGSGIKGRVKDVFIQSDGKILLGGLFTDYDGTAQNNITRLNSDGSIDSSFNIGSGFNDVVNTITVQSDGKILVGGKFTTFKGISSQRIIRLLSTGEKDNSFQILGGFDSDVNKIIVDPSENILVAGAFSSYQYTPKYCIIRLNLNGSVDNSFISPFSSNTYPVLEMKRQSDGKILASSYDLDRLNSDGSIDNSFNVRKIDLGTIESIKAITILSNGKILVAGYIPSYNGQITQENLILFNSNGTIDTSFKSNLEFECLLSSCSTSINYLNVQKDGKILVGGNFLTKTRDPASDGLVRLYGTSSILSNDEFYTSKKDLLIYPNPVKDFLHIDYTNKLNYNYEIYNLEGKKVLEGITIFNKIDLSELVQGTYILKMDNYSTKYSYKFIKE